MPYWNVVDGKDKPDVNIKSGRPRSALSAKSGRSEVASTVSTEIRPWTSVPSQRHSKDAGGSKGRNKHGQGRARSSIDDSGQGEIRKKEIPFGVQDPISWSITQLPDNDYNAKEEDAVVSKQRRGCLVKSASLLAWLDRPPEEDDDEYDTDLEDDFPQGDVRSPESSGSDVYEQRCKMLGLVPVGYMLRHLGDRHIRMRHHYLGGLGSKPLAAAFRRNTITESLDLCDNYVDQIGAVYLASVLRENQFLLNMNISQNFIGSRGCASFAQALDANTTLKVLNMSDNQLEDRDAKPLAEALKNNSSLISLNISNNKIGELGGVYLGQALTLNDGLVDLDLSWNCVRLKGAVAITNALKSNTTLEALDVSWNGFGLAGAVALGKALKVNTRLKVLDLSNNNLNADAIKKLAPGIAKNEGLETLMLSMNPVGEAGLEALIKAVTANQTIRVLGLEEISLTPKVYQKVTQLQESRDMVILHSGVGGYHKAQVHQTVMSLFDKFVGNNKEQLDILFKQLDKDVSGDITVEELKCGLRETGMALPGRMIDLLLEEIDIDKNGAIEYHELLSGDLRLRQRASAGKKKMRDLEMTEQSEHQVALSKDLEEKMNLAPKRVWEEEGEEEDDSPTV